MFRFVIAGLVFIVLGGCSSSSTLTGAQSSSRQVPATPPSTTTMQSGKPTSIGSARVRPSQSASAYSSLNRSVDFCTAPGVADAVANLYPGDPQGCFRSPDRHYRGWFQYYSRAKGRAASGQTVSVGARTADGLSLASQSAAVKKVPGSTVTAVTLGGYSCFRVYEPLVSFLGLTCIVGPDALGAAAAFEAGIPSNADALLRRVVAAGISAAGR
jgi:hypothetical protein